MAMANHWMVQASGAMFDTIEPPDWTFVFAVFVTDQDGTPILGLKKTNFSVWEISDIEELDLMSVTEVNADFPASKMPGLYRVQTVDRLSLQSPSPQEFALAIRVGSKRGKAPPFGVTTASITYLGEAK
jgi:hypothetical protein